MTEDLRLRCIACESPIRPGAEQYDDNGNSWHPECAAHPLGEKVDALYHQLQKDRDYIADLRTRFDAAEAHIGRLLEALEPFGRLAEEIAWNRCQGTKSASNAIQSHTPIDMRIDDLVRARAILLSTPAESLERLRHLERIADENYADLLDQMDEAWGHWPDAGAAPEVGRPEINAFLESRIVHKPTTELRERLRKLEAVVEAAREVCHAAPSIDDPNFEAWRERNKDIPERRLAAALSAAEARNLELDAHIGRLATSVADLLDELRAANVDNTSYQTHDRMEAARAVLSSTPADSLERLRYLDQMLYEARNPMLPNGEAITVEEMYAAWQKAEERLQKIERQNTELVDLLREFISSPPEFDDERIKYVVVQVSRGLLSTASEYLSALDAEVKR